MERALWFGDATVVVHVRAEDSDGRIGVWESVEPHGLALPLHVHTREDEQVLVLEGEITFRVGDEVHSLVAGDTLALPRGVPHAHVVTSASARALTIATPGGFERLFTDLGTPAAPGSTPPPADLDAMGRAVEELGVRRIGPPLQVPRS